MGASKEDFIHFQESEYYESGEYQLKQYLTLPAVKNQQVIKPITKANGKHGKS